MRKLKSGLYSNVFVYKTKEPGPNIKFVRSRHCVECGRRTRRYLYAFPGAPLCMRCHGGFIESVYRFMRNSDAMPIRGACFDYAFLRNRHGERTEFDRKSVLYEPYDEWSYSEAFPYGLEKEEDLEDEF